MNQDLFNSMETYSEISPVINRCFCTKKNTMPAIYHERISHCYELEYITWGQGCVITDGEYIPAVGGTVFFRRPNMKIHGILPYTSYGILMDSFPVENVPLVCNFSASNSIAFLFQDVYQSYLSGTPLMQLKMKADIMNIIYYMLDYERNVQEQKETLSVRYHLEDLERLKRYMDENLSRRITLDELADLCNISPSFLCRLFKQAYYETVFSYLTRQRVQKAKHMLIETNNPIKDICMSCGFENESYFYRTFKRIVQMSPSCFRKIHRQPFDDMNGE